MAASSADSLQNCWMALWSGMRMSRQRVPVDICSSRTSPSLVNLQSLSQSTPSTGYALPTLMESMSHCSAASSSAPLRASVST